MRHKRKIVLAVIAVMVLTLSACGGKGDVKICKEDAKVEKQL